MSIRTASFLLIGVLLAGSAGAQMMTATERPIETTTLTLSLPSALPATIAVAPCDTGCVPLRLNVTAGTRLFAGARAVTLEELRKFASGSSMNVAIFYEPQTRDVTRIVVTGRK
jgi:hypothetical protein